MSPISMLRPVDRSDQNLQADYASPGGEFLGVAACPSAGGGQAFKVQSLAVSPYFCRTAYR